MARVWSSYDGCSATLSPGRLERARAITFIAAMNLRWRAVRTRYTCPGRARVAPAHLPREAGRFNLESARPDTTYTFAVT